MVIMLLMMTMMISNDNEGVCDVGNDDNDFDKGFMMIVFLRCLYCSVTPLVFWDA